MPAILATELVVTATGMTTEIGRIAGMLHAAEPEPTPLQRQIAALSRTLALIAGAVIVVVFLLGLVRGQDFDGLFVSAVSLAVAAIPEGLPAVVAFTLAMGTTRTVEMDVLHGFFTTTDLSSGEWLVCAAVGSAILWGRRTRQDRDPGPRPAARPRCMKSSSAVTDRPCGNVLDDSALEMSDPISTVVAEDVDE